MVCQTVSVVVCVVTTVSVAQTAELIENEKPFGGGGRVAWIEGIMLYMGYGRHLANMTERSLFGSDAACQYHYCSNLSIFVLH